MPRGDDEVPSPFLNVGGRTRADTLPAYFDDGTLRTLKRGRGKRRAIFPRPTIAFAPYMGSSGSVRSRETLGPLIDKFQIPFYVEYQTDNVLSVAQDILALDSNEVVVVAWAREYIPKLAQALMVPTGHFPAVWESDIYSDMWVIRYEEPDIDPTQYQGKHIDVHTWIEFQRILRIDRAEYKRRIFKKSVLKRKMCTTIFWQ